MNFHPNFHSKTFLNNPLVLFVKAIISKWILIILTSSIVTTFWLFKNLKDMGIIDHATTLITTATNEVESVTRYCIPRIIDLKEFWKCLQNPPTYQATKVDTIIQETLKPSKIKHHEPEEHLDKTYYNYDDYKPNIKKKSGSK